MLCELRREIGNELRRWHRLVAQNRAADFARGRAVERHLAGRHLVNHRAERKQIAARVNLFAAHLLGRHVRHGAQHGAGTGEMLRAGVGNLGLGFRAVFLRAHLRQSEVENLGVPAPRDENVRRLDVAMNDALAVRRIQRVGHFGSEIEQQLVLHRTPGDAMLQRYAVEEFHHHEDAAVFFADVVNSADIGMIQRRCRTRLAAEALQCSRIARYVVGQELERDKASQARVLGLVDDTHAAAAKLLDNAVVRDGGVNHVLMARKECLMIGR